MSGSGSSLRQLWRLVRLARPSRAALAGAALAAMLSAGATLLFPLLAKRMVDELGGGRLDAASVAAIAAVLVASAIASAVSSYLLARTGHGLVAALRRLLVGKLLKMPVPAFDADSTGARVSRVLSDCDSISELATRQSVNLLTGIMLLAGSVVVLVLLDGRLTLTLFACLAVAFAIVIPLARLLEGLARGTQDRTARLAGILAHVFSEIRLVKAFTAEAREQERAGREIEEIRRLGLRTARINAGLEPIIGLSLTAALLVILMYGALRVNSGAIGMGTLTAFLLYIFNVAAPLIQLTNFTAELQKAKGASARIAALLDEVEEGSLAGLAQARRAGELAFRGVCFAYPGREERVLHNIDLVFRPGSTTALVGASGGGKTTILSLIERFYAPDAGEIVYDGRPISSLPLAAWRGRIGYVAQGAPIMPGTVRENITYGLAGDYPDEMVLAAAERAGALSFIEQMPRGLDTPLIEQGNNLSGGQRQRIAIARMFLRNPDILILDEATSSLDSETEYQVREALSALMAGRTNIVVAHRLATVVHADRIYFLEDGRISGMGRHTELLGSHPYYARLVAHQLQPELAAGNG